MLNIAIRASAIDNSMFSLLNDHTVAVIIATFHSWPWISTLETAGHKDRVLVYNNICNRCHLLHYLPYSRGLEIMTLMPSDA